MTYALLLNAIRIAGQKADECGIPWRVLEVQFGPETRYSVNHINCNGWAKEYPTIAIVYPRG